MIFRLRLIFKHDRAIKSQFRLSESNYNFNLPDSHSTCVKVHSTKTATNLNVIMILLHGKLILTVFVEQTRLYNNTTACVAKVGVSG